MYKNVIELPEVVCSNAYTFMSMKIRPPNPKGLIGFNRY